MIRRAHRSMGTLSVAIELRGSVIDDMSRGMTWKAYKLYSCTKCIIILSALLTHRKYGP